MTKMLKIVVLEKLPTRRQETENFKNMRVVILR